MGIGKEELIKLEELESMQTRIFPDACDYGLVETDEIKKEVREIVEYFKSLDKYFKVKKTKYSTGFSWVCNTQLLIETSDYYPGKYCGYAITIEYTYSNTPLFKGRPEHGFFTFDISYEINLEG